ncbi:hypothetical protein F4780DRAFT_717426 [Xylariomycetidae sp. FL0641]|nr:hypothetical protein F4780DRAFT_717426 [Xylariomycetidae sp. FL0641]
MHYAAFPSLLTWNLNAILMATSTQGPGNRTPVEVGRNPRNSPRLPLANRGRGRQHHDNQRKQATRGRQDAHCPLYHVPPTHDRDRRSLCKLACSLSRLKAPPPPGRVKRRPRGADSGRKLLRQRFEPPSHLTDPTTLSAGAEDHVEFLSFPFLPPTSSRSLPKIRAPAPRSTLRSAPTQRPPTYLRWPPSPRGPKAGHISARRSPGGLAVESARRRRRLRSRGSALLPRCPPGLSFVRPRKGWEEVTHISDAWRRGGDGMALEPGPAGFHGGTALRCSCLVSLSSGGQATRVHW